MAKRRFNIAPKLTDPKKESPKVKKLPVQKISVEAIEKIAIGEQSSKSETKETAPVVQENAKQSKTIKTKNSPISEPNKKKRPQGRPKRKEPVKRLSSDLPADLYDQVKMEISEHGYSLNGFLAKVLRDYFSQK